MRKNVQTLLTTLVLMTGASLVFSCAKAEVEAPASVASVSGETVTIGAVLPESVLGTKVSLSPLAAGGMDLNWEAGDALSVSSGSSSSLFTLSSGAGTKNAYFVGNAVSGSAYDIVYPGSLATYAEAEAYSYVGQVQDGNGSTAHLQYVAALSGVNAYENFAFSSAWASGAGGSFRHNACLKLRLKLPASVSTVSGVSVSAPRAIFHSSNAAASTVKRISLALENVDVSQSDQVLTAYLMMSWQNAVLNEGESLTVAVTYGEEACTRSVAFASGYTFEGGYEYLLQLNDSGWTTGAGFEGDGSEDDPYLIRTPLQLLSVNPLLKSGETVYFTLMNDLDMSSQEWVPLHNEWGNKAIFFDGGSHTVSNITSNISGGYNGFFGQLNGTVKNLNIDRISVYARGGYPSGALAGWLGSNPADATVYTATVDNVHITNASVNNTMSSAVGTGGFAARVGRTTFSHSSFSGSVNNATSGSVAVDGTPTGGISAYDYGQCSYEDVSFEGSLSVTNSFNNVGGIIGYAADATTLTACEVNITAINVASSSNIGGLVGYANGVLTVNGATPARSVIAFPTFSAVSFVGGVVGRTAAAPSIAHYSVTLPVTATASSVSRVGGVLGYSAEGSTISDCQANVDLTGYSSLAGIVAYGTQTTTVTDCSVSGTLTADNTYAYPCIAGIMGGSTGTTNISGCTSDVTFDSHGSSTGGIYGQTGDGVVLSIDKCSFTGAINTSTKTSMYAAGILAYARNAKTVTITRCSSTADIYCCARVGGIMGYSNNSNQSGATITIENCWASGLVQVRSYESTGGGYSGGIVGDIQKNVTIRNCYFTGSVKGNFASGGIVGRASNALNTVAGATTAGGFGDTVSGCICWAELITSQDNYKRSTVKGFSDGAIVGFTNVYNTLSNCWRKNGLNFLWYSTTHGGAEWDPVANALKDQNDADASTALTDFPQGYEFDYPYNGKAAAASESLSDVAQRIGWSASIWDFSGDAPVIR